MSDLLKCLIPDSQLQTHLSPSIDVRVLNGAAIVNMLPPIECNLPFSKSLKNNTHKNHSQGLRRKVTDDGSLPKNWNSFLRWDENKKLFPFLSKFAIKEIPFALVFATVK